MPSLSTFARAGPNVSRESGCVLLREEPTIHSVAFTFDDVVELDHRPHRRICVHVERRGMPAAAIVEPASSSARGDAVRLQPRADVRAFVRRTELHFG
jgi:hypothetical protein